MLSCPIAATTPAPQPGLVPADRRGDEAGAVDPSEDAIKKLDESWMAWAKAWMEMSIVASDEVWRIVEPLFDEMRTAYFQRQRPPEHYEDALREQMRRELR